MITYIAVLIVILGLGMMATLINTKNKVAQSKDYYGSWSVERVYSPEGIIGSADNFLSEKEINNFSKFDISLGEKTANIFTGTGTCTSINYDESMQNTVEFFYDNYKILAYPDMGRTTTTTFKPELLGITSSKINVVEITCSTIEYYNLIVLNRDNMILEYKNTFFFLKRN